jgi:hypothetical protein
MDEIIDFCQNYDKGNIVYNDMPNNSPIGEDWVEDMFGITEDGNLNRINLEYEYTPENGMLITEKGDYLAGLFSAPQLGEIIDFLEESINKPETNPNLKRTIINGRDVSDYIVNTIEEYSMVQAASQFNSLEMTGPSVTPEEGIGIYQYDRTQGPAVAMTAAPGTFVRNYAIIESLGKQFNGLEDLNLEIQNGYLRWGNAPDSVLQKVKNRENHDKIRVPFMLYTQLVGYHSTVYKGPFKFHQTTKLSHQAYTSSAPINIYGNSGNREKQYSIGYHIVTLEYKAMIAMSIILHQLDKDAGITTKEYPTIDINLIGTGAFNNPLGIILSALATAILYFKDYPVTYRIHTHGGNNATVTGLFDTDNINLLKLANFILQNIQHPEFDGYLKDFVYTTKNSLETPQSPSGKSPFEDFAGFLHEYKQSQSPKAKSPGIKRIILDDDGEFDGFLRNRRNQNVKRTSPKVNSSISKRKIPPKRESSEGSPKIGGPKKIGSGTVVHRKRPPKVEQIEGGAVILPRKLPPKIGAPKKIGGDSAVMPRKRPLKVEQIESGTVILPRKLPPKVAPNKKISEGSPKRKLPPKIVSKKESIVNPPKKVGKKKSTSDSSPKASPQRKKSPKRISQKKEKVKTPEIQQTKLFNPPQTIDDFIVATSNNGVLKFYRPRYYQIDMFKQIYEERTKDMDTINVSSYFDSVDYEGYPIESELESHKNPDDGKYYFLFKSENSNSYSAFIPKQDLDERGYTYTLNNNGIYTIKKDRKVVNRIEPYSYIIRGFTRRI